MSNYDPYTEGRRALASKLLTEMLGELAPDAPEQALAARHLESARAALREVCRWYGDNDWADTLNLGDVVEKHLRRRLDERRPKLNAIYLAVSKSTDPAMKEVAERLAEFVREKE